MLESDWLGVRYLQMFDWETGGTTEAGASCWGVIELALAWVVDEAIGEVINAVIGEVVDEEKSMKSMNVVAMQ